MKKLGGFTLVELITVILILGIIAAVAYPKFLNACAEATDQGLKQTLSIVRDAIELYKINNGAFPGADKQEATFKADLSPYLRKWPENPMAAKPAKSDEVRMRHKGDPLVSQINNNEGWIYDNVTGEFRANTDALSCDGVTTYSRF